MISGIVHVLKSGGRWVDAPPIYGPRKTLYNRFVRWFWDFGRPPERRLTPTSVKEQCVAFRAYRKFERVSSRTQPCAGASLVAPWLKRCRRAEA